MSRLFRPIDRVAGRTVRAAAASVATLWCIGASPQSLTLSGEPLANTPPRVKPNLMFVMDDSGSMAERFTPDYVDDSRACYRFSDAGLVNGSRNCAEGEPPFNASYFNTQYYNPAIRYLPGLDAVTQAELASQTRAATLAWTRVRTDAYGNNNTTDLTTGMPDRAYCETGVNNFDVRRCVFNVGPYVLPNARYPNVVSIVNVPQYVTAVPTEYCADAELTKCAAGTAPSSNYPFPAYLQWCNSSKLTNCQARATDTYNYAKHPTAQPASVLLTFTAATALTPVRGLTIGGVDVLGGAVISGSSPQELATLLAAAINAYVNQGAAGDFSAVGDTNTAAIRIYAPAAAGASANGLAVQLDTNALYVFAPRADLSGGASGGLSRQFIVPSRTAYPKAPGRTDCVDASCTYDEEMTNFANWFTYYRTRMQTLKTAAGRAFASPLVVGTAEAGFRIGLMTINDTTGNRYVNVADFYDPAKREAWYRRFYGVTPGSSTPLRSALSRAGRVFGGVSPYRNVGFVDPVQYSCQQNFTLLTTDGYWNETDTAQVSQIVQLDGTTMIDNQDNTEPRPYYDGVASGTCPGDPTASTGTTCNTLSDVALYYYKTDLRTPALNNCSSAGRDVCANNVRGTQQDPSTAQHMVTFTLGLGVDGTLRYREDYEEALDGDFHQIRIGTREWPRVRNLHPTAVDDLWHAAVNGRGKYLNARDPVGLARALDTALASAQAVTGAGSAAAASSLEPVAGDNFVYLAGYTTVDWSGNLEARTIDPQTGAIGAQPVWCAENTTGADGQTTTCTGTMRAQVGATGDSRTIYTFAPAAARRLRNFDWPELTASERALFSDMSVLTQWSSFTDAQRAAATGENLVRYLRGQFGLEDVEGNSLRIFRNRKAVLGDIVGGRPVFVGQPQFDYTENDYTAFKRRTRTKMVYVAANDGMLHAFDAATGVERWAYVPTQLFAQMRRLADKEYATRHVFLNDGAPIVGDIFDGSRWRTVLVGGFNAGGRGYYALDITDPAAPEALWEISASTDGDVGFSFGNPLIVKDGGGTWRVLLTSGYNNVNPGSGRGVLFVVDPVSGGILRRVYTGTGSLASPSGLAKMAAYVENGALDNTATHLYAGDIQGTLWRVDAGTWSVSRIATLTDSAGTRQPITTRPALGKVENQRFIVVGTGKLLEPADRESVQTQTIYGFFDKFDAAGALDSPRSVLVQQTLTNAVDSSGRRIRNASANSIDLTRDRGWYVNLPDGGERVNVDPRIVAGVAVIPSNVASVATDACQASGYGWLNFLSVRTGGRLQSGSPASYYKDSQIVGVTEIKAGGTLGVLVRTSDGKTVVDALPPNPGTLGFQGKRTSWRELAE